MREYPVIHTPKKYNKAKFHVEEHPIQIVPADTFPRKTVICYDFRDGPLTEIVVLITPPPDLMHMLNPR